MQIWKFISFNWLDESIEWTQYYQPKFAFFPSHLIQLLIQYSVIYSTHDSVIQWAHACRNTNERRCPVVSAWCVFCVHFTVTEAWNLIWELAIQQSQIRNCALTLKSCKFAEAHIHTRHTTRVTWSHLIVPTPFRSKIFRFCTMQTRSNQHSFDGTNSIAAHAVSVSRDNETIN